MTLDIGKEPPLHRRFNQKKAIEHIRNRYRHAYEQIRKQVKILQHSKEFRDKCKELYEQGYKDWVILSAILNCKANWTSQIQRTSLADLDSKQYWKLIEESKDVVFLPKDFLSEDFDKHIGLHFVMALTTWGFQLRRRDFDPKVVENFMRKRMKHLDFDLPHKPLFGDPLGDWPKI